MALKFRKVLYSVIVSVGLFLSVIILLGVKQYFLYKHYVEVVEHSELLVFNFSNIKEHITEALISDKNLDTEETVKDIEGLNNDISKILDDILIPDEYKLIFINQVDIGGIVLQLRNIRDVNNSTLNEKRQNLASDLRLLSGKLNRFNHIIGQHVQAQMAGFQKLIVGSLAFVIFALTSLFYLWNRKIAVPLLSLIRQAGEIKQGIVPDRITTSANDLLKITDALNILISQNKIYQAHTESTKKFVGVFSKITKFSYDCKNENDFLAKSCRGLLSNSDYCLVWAGIKKENETDVTPVAADGCTTMDDSECSECMTVLLTSAEEKGYDFNPALQAITKGEAVVLRDILKDTPVGSIRKTPLAKGFASCAAIPLLFRKHKNSKEDQEIYGVISIYSTKEDSFDEIEMMLLEVLSYHISEIMMVLKNKFLVNSIRAISDHSTEEDAIELQAIELTPETELIQEIKSLQAERKQLFNNACDLTLLVDNQSVIIDVGPSSEKILGIGEQNLIGKKIYELFPVLNEKEKPKVDDLSSHSVNSKARVVSLLGRFFEIKVISIGLDKFFVILKDVTKEHGMKVNLERSCKLAAAGELSAGMAHEINNHVNGIINYAQVLLDQTDVITKSSTDTALLGKIIAEGDNIASMLSQLLKFMGDKGELENLEIEKALLEIVALVENQFKLDGIEIQLSIESDLPVTSFNPTHFQQILLNLLSNARHALNSKYPEADVKKKIEVSGKVLNPQERERMISVSVTDFGTGIKNDILSEVFEPFFSTKHPSEGTGLGLTVSRQLLLENNGDIEIESTENKFTKVTVFIPV